MKMDTLDLLLHFEKKHILCSNNYIKILASKNDRYGPYQLLNRLVTATNIIMLLKDSQLTIVS